MNASMSPNQRGRPRKETQEVPELVAPGGKAAITDAQQIENQPKKIPKSKKGNSDLEPVATSVIVGDSQKASSSQQMKTPTN